MTRLAFVPSARNGFVLPRSAVMFFSVSSLPYHTIRLLTGSPEANTVQLTYPTPRQI